MFSHSPHSAPCPPPQCRFCPLAAKKHHGRAECPAEEPGSPLPGWAALLLPDTGEALLCPGLCQRRRGMGQGSRVKGQRRGISSSSGSKLM